MFNYAQQKNRLIPTIKPLSYLKFGLLSVLVILLYHPEISSMVNEWWTKHEYSHGFLIPFISGYIIWVKREVLRAQLVIPDIKGFFILLAGIALLITGYVSFEPFTRRFSLLITIFGLVYFLLGSGIFKILLFPVGYLVFMIPPPYILFKSTAVNLRLFSTKVTYDVINFLGIPILRQGANLDLPNISLVVADFCTGILSLMSIIAVAVLYAYLTQKKLLNRTILVFLSVPIAIAGNIFRLVITVCLAYFYGARALDSVIHQFHGTVNFLITLVLLIFAGNMISKVDLKLSTKSRTL
jgi:exosortase